MTVEGTAYMLMVTHTDVGLQNAVMARVFMREQAQADIQMACTMHLKANRHIQMAEDIHIVHTQIHCILNVRADYSVHSHSFDAHIHAYCQAKHVQTHPHRHTHNTCRHISARIDIRHNRNQDISK